MIKKIALFFTFIIALNTTNSLHTKSEFSIYAVILTIGILIGATLMKIYLKTNKLKNKIDNTSQPQNNNNALTQPKKYVLNHDMSDKVNISVNDGIKLTINITTENNWLETLSTEQPIVVASDSSIKISGPISLKNTSYNLITKIMNYLFNENATHNLLECSLHLTEKNFNNIATINVYNKTHIIFNDSTKTIPLKKLYKLTADNNTTIENLTIDITGCNFFVTNNSNVTVTGKSAGECYIIINNNSIFDGGELKDIYPYVNLENNSTAILHTKNLLESSIDNSSWLTINDNTRYSRSFKNRSQLKFYQITPPKKILAS